MYLWYSRDISGACMPLYLIVTTIAEWEGGPPKAYIILSYMYIYIYIYRYVCLYIYMYIKGMRTQRFGLHTRDQYFGP